MNTTGTYRKSGQRASERKVRMHQERGSPTRKPVRLGRVQEVPEETATGSMSRREEVVRKKCRKNSVKNTVENRRVSA